MRRIVWETALLALVVAAPAAAQVSATLTSSTATVDFAPPVGQFSFSAPNLDGFLNDPSPSGANYNSRNELDGGKILFVNGNVTSGSFAMAKTFTSLDISFKSEDAKRSRLIVNSTLLPAGFGLFVADSNCAAGAPIACVEAVGAPGFAGMPLNQAGQSEDRRLAFTSFDFNIFTDEQSIFSLTASIALVYDEELGRNVIVTDFGRAAEVLNGFTAFKDTSTALAYVWDSTDVEFDLGFLGPGETRTLTYTTSVTTFTRSFGDGTNGLVAFGEFGDPVGRGGAIPPPANISAARFALDSLAFDGPRGPEDQLVLQRPSLFSLPAPVFSGGVLGVLTTVPEPGTWAMLLTGFGLSGAALRRQRRMAAA